MSISFRTIQYLFIPFTFGIDSAKDQKSHYCIVKIIDNYRNISITICKSEELYFQLLHQQIVASKKVYAVTKFLIAFLETLKDNGQKIMLIEP